VRTISAIGIRRLVVEEHSVAAQRFKPGEPENVNEVVHFGVVDGFHGGATHGFSLSFAIYTHILSFSICNFPFDFMFMIFTCLSYN
jgi:hypothetical protein